MRRSVPGAARRPLIETRTRHRTTAGVVDLDLSDEHLVAGDRLQAGTVMFEVTAAPHNGCRKYADRYGKDAVVFANSPVGKALHLRGINVRVVQAGTLRAGEPIRRR